MTSLLCGIEKHQTQKNKVEWGAAKGHRRCRKWGDVGKGYKPPVMSKFWASDVQHGNYS